MGHEGGDRRKMRWTDGEMAWVVARYLHGYTQRAIADELGVTAPVINVQVRKFCELWAREPLELVYDSARRAVARRALDRFLWVGGTLSEPTNVAERNTPSAHRPIPYFDERYGKARYEHVWLLRAEGLLLSEIGDRVGVSRERARQMIMKYGRTMTWAMRRTRWRMVA